MDKDTEAKLFAATLYTITRIWGDEMDDLQRMSLANEIVHEIERRNIVGEPDGESPIVSPLSVVQ